MLIIDDAVSSFSLVTTTLRLKLVDMRYGVLKESNGWNPQHPISLAIDKVLNVHMAS